MVTRKLDLRTGRPVWFAYRAPRVATEKLTRDVSCDAVVVGLGISGAMMAEALTAQGLLVVGVDRRGPITGSTPATTALVQFEIDEPITSLSKKIGNGDAEQAWRRSQLATTNLRGRIAELRIDCDVESKPSLYIAGNAMGPRELREEAEARRSAGLRATYLTPAMLRNVFGIERKGAILSQDNLALDPRKLTAGLLNKAAERGARFYAPVEVTDVTDNKNGVRLETRDGVGISARYAVLATGYELMDFVPSSNHAVISTFAMATRRQKDAIWQGQAFIWEASDPYLYMRATRDGRVICGGEDEDFEDEGKRDALLPGKVRKIAAKLKTLFPQLDTEPEFAWAGSFGTTTTGLPYIGALPGRPQVFAVQGYGGNGITFSQIASEVIPTIIGGGEDADQRLFAYGRTSLLRKIVDLSGRLVT